MRLSGREHRSATRRCAPRISQPSPLVRASAILWLTSGVKLRRSGASHGAPMAPDGWASLGCFFIKKDINRETQAQAEAKAARTLDVIF